jgi:carbon monoxide dehydrogenase subunit G
MTSGDNPPMPTLTLHDDLTVPVPRATAWSSLHDLPLLAEALTAFHGPQASLTAQPDGASYRLTLPGFEGQVQVLDVERPSRLRFSFEGQGATTGAVQGQVQCRLELLGDERTLLHWSVVLQTEQQPGGLKLRSITALKKQLQALEAVIRERHASHLPVPVPPVRKPWPQRLLDWYLGWFAGIFNGTLYPAPKPKPRRDPPAR